MLTTSVFSEDKRWKRCATVVEWRRKGMLVLWTDHSHLSFDTDRSKQSMVKLQIANQYLPRIVQGNLLSCSRSALQKRWFFKINRAENIRSTNEFLLWVSGKFSLVNQRRTEHGWFCGKCAKNMFSHSENKRKLTWEETWWVLMNTCTLSFAGLRYCDPLSSSHDSEASHQRLVDFSAVPTKDSGSHYITTQITQTNRSLELQSATEGRYSLTCVHRQQPEKTNFWNKKTQETWVTQLLKDVTKNYHDIWG